MQNKIRTWLAISLAAAAMLITAAMPAAAQCSRDTGCYGSIAAALWRDRDGTAFVAGNVVRNYSTQAEADMEALTSCSTVAKNCKIVGTFGTGQCGFLSLGRKSNGVTYGIGPTSMDAEEKCESEGFTCQVATGGCAGLFDDGEESDVEHE